MYIMQSLNQESIVSIYFHRIFIFYFFLFQNKGDRSESGWIKSWKKICHTSNCFIKGKLRAIQNFVR